MDDKYFPKWQISKFENGNKNLQSVFRTNDEEEYKKVKAEWLTEVEVKKDFPDKPMTQGAPDTKMCPIHNVKMYLKDGKFGPYYSHGNKETGYCNGKPKYEKTY